MNKNKTFFANKNWKQIFSELKFDSYYQKLCKKLKNKKIVFYGAGIMFDYFLNNYNTEQLNIIGIADKNFKLQKPERYNNKYNLLAPDELPTKDIDAIIISTLYPFGPRNYMKQEVYKEKKMPKIYFLLNKPFILFLEEIFNTL